MIKKIILLSLLFVLSFSCKKEKPEVVPVVDEVEEIEGPKIIEEFGYILNDYKVIRDTIKNGETFGEILDRHHIGHTSIFNIAAAAKDTFD
ncbi:MAG: M23 family peptidase, partial [Bacteroidetes bacterium]